METTSNKIPLYAKTALIFIRMFAFVYTLYIGQQIIIPLVYATIIAILLNPVVNFLTRHKFNRFIAIILSVILAIAIVAGILAVLISQGDNFMSSAPEMQEKFTATFSQFVNWVSNQMGVEPEKVNQWISDTRSEQLNNLEVKENIARFGHILMTTVLLPVYMVMLLYYKPLLLEFVHRVFRSENQDLVKEVLTNTKKIIQSYLIGLFIEMFIVGVLNAVGLLIIGIKYAVLLGLIGALLNIIPYLGAIIATSIFMLIALLTESPIYMLYVLLMYLFIQFIDNNFLLPKIVASRVKINALVSIIVVLLGAAVWGVPGMFLGDTMPKAISIKKISFRKKTKAPAKGD